MKRRYLSSLAAVGFAALFYGPSPALAQAYLGPNLTPFAVLAGSTVTCAGTGATITGDLGLSPGTAVTGPCVVTGATHVADAAAAAAQVDLTTAFTTTLGPSLPCGLDLTGTDLGGLTLTPGVYCFSTSAQLTGTLTLNGSSSAVWVFKTGSTLTTASGSSVVFIGGGNPCAVQWRVGTSATLGTTTNFSGNILAQSSITLNTGASLNGRALARTGAVTLDGNNVALFTACGAGGGIGGVPPPFPGAAPTPLPSPSPVPTLPEIGAWALLLVLLGIGAYALSRRTPTEASK